MAALHQIDVHGIRIYTNHGCMQEEAVIGSNYEVNISVWADLSASVASDDLNDTVDYVALNAIAKEEMAVRAKLLLKKFIIIFFVYINDIKNYRKIQQVENKNKHFCI